MVLTPYSSRVSILESGKLAQYEWICKDHLESWRALLSTVEAAGLACHTGHITARKVTTLSHRYQQVDKPAMTRTAAPLPPPGSVLRRLPLRVSAAQVRGTPRPARPYLRSLVIPVTAPSGAFCLHSVVGMMNAFGRLLSARLLVLEGVGTSNSFSTATGKSC